MLSSSKESNDQYYKNALEAVNYIKSRAGDRIDKCKIGLVLGSGLGDFAETLKDAVVISYKDIPHYPASTVAGHKGNLVIGHHNGTYVVTMQGRKHYYESVDNKIVTFPVRVFSLLGCKVLFCTNASGGVNESYKVGDFMIIKDHINFNIPNPCLGPNDERFGTRFHDMSNAYDADYRTLIKNVAKAEKIPVREGVYLACTGPSYETPAEIKTFRGMGADNVGMSTAPEVIVGAHCGMKCIGISCITNMAAGVIKGTKLNHDEVKEVADRKKPEFMRLLGASISALAKTPECSL